MKSLRIKTASTAGGLLVIIGLFGSLFGTIYTHDQSVSWQMGSIIIVASLVLLCLAFTHSRFVSWDGRAGGPTLTNLNAMARPGDHRLRPLAGRRLDY